MSFAVSCWNCSATAPQWIETTSLELCTNCGIACYYHGTGANQSYLDAMERKRKQAEDRRFEETHLADPYNE